MTWNTGMPPGDLFERQRQLLESKKETLGKMLDAAIADGTSSKRVLFVVDSRDPEYQWLVNGLSPEKRASVERLRSQNLAADACVLIGWANIDFCPVWVLEEAWNRVERGPRQVPLIVDLFGIRSVMPFNSADITQN